MVQHFQSDEQVPAGAWAIVVSQYNVSITQKLLDGALKTFAERGIDESFIHVAWVPGAFEIPLIAEHLASTQAYRAVLGLGAVIRGETTHDQHINRAVSEQIAEIGVRHRVPVLFGVLTCDTLEQAIQRAGGNQGNKGAECAEAAIAMARLKELLPPPK